MFNLLTSAWVPVLRRSGHRACIRPAELTEYLDSDPVIALDWPRADFRIAGLEFLVGLFATAAAPAGHRAWRDGWYDPPPPAALDAAFAPFAHAFSLDGDGPRFLQDREDLVSDAEPIERLLIEAPGASTIRQNTDLLVRRGRVAGLGRASAAMALYTFQSWAPAGGAGNRTGLRGGGPMVTLVQPPGRPSLWHQIWANVPDSPEPVEPEDHSRIFPWLAPTLTSESGRAVSPEANAHPLQCWWGMPRRIRLNFADLDAPAPCDLTGTPDSVRVTGWRQRPRGANYAGWGDIHPLTPSYQVKAGAEVLPLHPQPGGVGYRHWLGLVLCSPDSLRRPAPAVTRWRDVREGVAEGGAARILAAGYDMDNMKARAFVESEMPLPAAPDADTRAALDVLATRLVLSANQVAGLLRSAVRFALFSAGASVKLDWELLSVTREKLWEGTEARFYALILARPPDASGQWLHHLRDVALHIFDEAAPLLPENGSAAPRISRARRGLLFALAGFGKEGTELFVTLELVAPTPKARKKGKAA
ncbi:type I-E CRISPR-associated protein Cse1/CasA [Falsiroseomonas selenitidurans]|uniref:Type I-E CRISPR-associated protein Cse1/CasA n=1 Tax=Falsiroseomonas selenitidurans TaxID=2716335 RepID=A0ABX1E5L2_9PROT|nr:type I-E CRISPR-associated protein Cse1/CasA [Falsiroseomonas selenitidurans]NKC30220.1 type I-E CRISPR-associated protein Cse1/CasA [Falsiroseomonas selenitidurans]